MSEQADLFSFPEAQRPPPDEPAERPPIDPGSFVEHPLIAPGAVEARAYQVTLAQLAQGSRILVVLPTGLGKTIIALMAAADVLQRNEGKVLFLAPTRPLVQQHADVFRKLLLVGEQVSLQGSIAATKRARLFDENRVIFSTPQGLHNDIEAGRLTLADVGLLIFDEAHRGTGEYAYVPIAEHYRQVRADGHVLGLTASPGGDAVRIDEVADNLGFEQVEARDEQDPDVSPYVKETSVRWIKRPLTPAMQTIRGRLEAIVAERAAPLRRARYLAPKPYVSRRDVIDAGNKLRAALPRTKNKGALFGMLLNQGVVMQALHCQELLETQGVEPLRDFLERQMRTAKTKSARVFLNDPRIVDVMARITEWRDTSHPKLDALVDVLGDELARNPDGLVIVFAQYRDTIASILRRLEAADIRAERFVGQADRDGDKGMKQSEQKFVLERFKNGMFRVLVASSVAEEGLDVPRVDLVVFYEPVPSEIRLIQRRGRTGRHEVGRVTVLLAEGTRDESFMFAAMGRERKMRRLVRGM